MPQSFASKPPSIAAAALSPSFSRATPAPGLAMFSPAIPCASPRDTLASATEAARTLPTSITSLSRRIRKSKASTVLLALTWNSCSNWRKRAKPASHCNKQITSITSCGWLCPLSREVEIAVLSDEPDVNAKQVRKMFRGEHGGFRPVGQDASFAQENHALDLWNDFGYVVCHQQNPEPGLRKLAHRLAKL